SAGRSARSRSVLSGQYGPAHVEDVRPQQAEQHAQGRQRPVQPAARDQPGRYGKRGRPDPWTPQQAEEDSGQYGQREYQPDGGSFVDTASVTAVSMASGMRASTCTRSSPNTSRATAANSPAGSARGDVLRVATTASTRGSSSSSMARASLSASTATTATSRWNANSSSSAATVAAMPCGLCAASSRIVGAVRTRSNRPGDVTSASPARTVATSSWR